MKSPHKVRAGIASRRPVVKLADAQPKGKAKPVTDQDIARLRDENARLRDENARLREQINRLNEARRRAASTRAAVVKLRGRA